MTYVTASVIGPTAIALLIVSALVLLLRSFANVENIISSGWYLFWLFILLSDQLGPFQNCQQSRRASVCSILSDLGHLLFHGRDNGHVSVYDQKDRKVSQRQVF